MNADSVKIESDERGFELHIETVDDGLVIVNIHACAEQLLTEAVREIGPWALEAMRVKREHDRTPFDQDSEQPWPGESAVDYYRRTGDTGLVFEHADTLRKARRENGDA